jgi:cytosine/adenosine deaminase-related metal-dependent hydrolase
MAGPLIEDGGVITRANRIVAVGPWSDLKPHITGAVEDLGEAMLMPGLINAHCHLDYTGMA